MSLDEVVDATAAPRDRSVAGRGGVARRFGFGTSINLRKHFANRLQTSPNNYRRSFQQPEVSAS